MNRLDLYEKKPIGMEHYLSSYGWHFSPKMYEWAVGMMRDRNGEKVKTTDKVNLIEQAKSKGITIDESIGYDALYILAMAKSDFWGSSLKTEEQLLLFVNDYLNDKDGYKEVAFTRFYADCIAKGIPIIWSDML